MSSSPGHGWPSRPLSRRAFLAGGLALGALVAGEPLRRTIPIFAPAPAGGAAGGTAPEPVHCTFGADPARSMVVTWSAPEPQPRPALRIGPSTHGPDSSVPLPGRVGAVRLPGCRRRHLRKRRRLRALRLLAARRGPGDQGWHGIRQAWLPLFDQYGVDLVVAGHSHDYERSFPVRGTHHDEGHEIKGGARVDTNRPRPVHSDAADQSIDTTQGTVHLVLGGGGTSIPSNVCGTDPGNGLPQAFVKVERDLQTYDPGTGLWSRGSPQAVEDAVWSAGRDTEDAYGVAVFDVGPGQGPWDRTSITMRYYHAPPPRMRARRTRCSTRSR